MFQNTPGGSNLISLTGSPVVRDSGKPEVRTFVLFIFSDSKVSTLDIQIMQKCPYNLHNISDLCNCFLQFTLHRYTKGFNKSLLFFLLAGGGGRVTKLFTVEIQEDDISAYLITFTIQLYEQAKIFYKYNFHRDIL